LNTPLVSFIIPVYNAENSILACLNSVIDQDFSNYEIIIINDGSKDDSNQLIRRFIESHKSHTITYFIQENKGASAARNSGIKKAKGEFIAFIDSDDTWHPTKLQRQVDILQHNSSIDLVATNRNNEKFTRFFSTKFSQLTPISLQLFLLKNFLLTPTVIFKREIINTVGYFDEEMTHAEDMHFLMRIAAQYNCYLLNESLVTTGFGKPSFGHSGLSGNTWKMGTGELKNITIAYKKGFLNTVNYCFTYSFSFLKFMRRIIITYYRKITPSKSYQ